MGWCFTVQMHNDPERTVKATWEFSQGKTESLCSIQVSMASFQIHYCGAQTNNYKKWSHYPNASVTNCICISTPRNHIFSKHHGQFRIPGTTLTTPPLLCSHGNHLKCWTEVTARPRWKLASCDSNNKPKARSRGRPDKGMNRWMDEWIKGRQ